jgi:hypothetical protein
MKRAFSAWWGSSMGPFNHNQIVQLDLYALPLPLQMSSGKDLVEKSHLEQQILSNKWEHWRGRDATASSLISKPLLLGRCWLTSWMEKCSILRWLPPHPRLTDLQVTRDAIVYQTKQGALGERFPSKQVGHPKSGSGVLPRVLVAFDCWGASTPRTGGALSCVYEFVKFVEIDQCLDPISPHSLKHATIPVAPHFFPKRDATQPPRQQSSRTTRVTLSLRS